VQPHSHKACRIAEEEINAGKVKWVVPEPSKTPAQVADSMFPQPVGGEADD
jgi:hypothetical protein